MRANENCSCLHKKGLRLNSKIDSKNGELEKIAIFGMLVMFVLKSLLEPLAML